MLVAVAEIDVAAAALAIVGAGGEAEGVGVYGGGDGEGVGEGARDFEVVEAGLGEGGEVGLGGGVSGGCVEGWGGEPGFKDDGMILGEDAEGCWRLGLGGELFGEKRGDLCVVGEIA